MPTPDPGRALGDLLALADPYISVTGDLRLEIDARGLRKAVPGADDLLDLARWESRLFQRLRSGGRLWARLPRAVLRFGPFFQTLPYPCAIRRWEETYPDAVSLREHLESLGYHQTAPYARIGRKGRDYSRAIPAYSYPAGAFRSQAQLVPLRNRRWGLYLQEPEPNPELLGYHPPCWWWPAYTLWWHKTLCTFL